MKSARERAIDAAIAVYEMKVSRAMFVQLLADDSEMGRTLTRTVSAIDRAIDADRRENMATRAPS